MQASVLSNHVPPPALPASSSSGVSGVSAPPPPVHIHSSKINQILWSSSAVRGMRVNIVSVMSSISAFLTDLKREFKLHTVYFGTLEQIKPLQPVGQAAEFKFESSHFEPLPVIWQSLPKAIPEDNRRFRGQINGQALGAALPHSLRE